MLAEDFDPEFHKRRRALKRKAARDTMLAPHRVGGAGGLVLCQWCGHPFSLGTRRLSVAPSHPALMESGVITWRMCKGSNKPGIPIRRMGT
jgi:hypothetical protein